MSLSVIWLCPALFSTEATCSVYLYRPAFASWIRKVHCTKPRVRLLIFLKQVTTCNRMHANWPPSADPWWFKVWLRWEWNRKVSKSHANSRQFGCLAIANRGRCLQHACRVRAHQQGGHMVSINHQIFLGAAGAGMSPRRSAAAGRLRAWRAATALLRLWKHSKRHHYHCLHSRLGPAFGPVPLSVMWIW